MEEQDASSASTDPAKSLLLQGFPDGASRDRTGDLLLAKQAAVRPEFGLFAALFRWRCSGLRPRAFTHFPHFSRGIGPKTGAFGPIPKVTSTVGGTRMIELGWMTARLPADCGLDRGGARAVRSFLLARPSNVLPMSDG